MSVYEENHVFLTFTDSAARFLWSTMQTSPCNTKHF